MIRKHQKKVFDDKYNMLLVRKLLKKGKFLLSILQESTRNDKTLHTF